MSKVLGLIGGFDIRSALLPQCSAELYSSFALDVWTKVINNMKVAR
jgi:hypothetical protein